MHGGGGVDSPSSALTPEGNMDLNHPNFHVFSDDVLQGMNGMGMVDILHTLTPEDNEDYMSMQFPLNAQGPKSPSNQPETLEHQAAMHNGQQEMELDDSSRSGDSADSPSDRAEESERGRTREWSRIPVSVEPGTAATEEVVEIKKEKSPMAV